MPPGLGKVRKEVSLTPKQKTVLEQLAKETNRTAGEVVGQLIEQYYESFKRKYS